MRPEDTAGPSRLLPVALGCFGLALVLQVLTWQVFYGDGAAWFAESLRRGEPGIWPAHRVVTTVIYTLPLRIGLRLGITDVEHLQVLFALGMLAPWPLALWLCWRLAPTHFWLPVTACAVGYLNSSLLAFSSALAAHALVWPPLMALVFVRPLTGSAAVVVAVFAALLLYSYESQVVIGPALAALAAWRLRGPESRAAKMVLSVSMLLFLASAWVALSGIQGDDFRVNRDSYLASGLRMLWQPSWNLAFCEVLILAAVAALWRPARALAALRRPTAAALLLAPLAAWGLWPLLAPGLFQPSLQYAERALNLAVPLALLPVALLAWRHPGWFARRLPLLRGAAAALLLAQSLWQVSATLQWQAYNGGLRAYLAAHSGPVPYTGSVIERLEQAGGLPRFTLGWTLPYLSLLLADRGRVQSLLWIETSFMPMDPRRLETVPDLARYGFDLAPYREALREAADAP